MEEIKSIEELEADYAVALKKRTKFVELENDEKQKEYDVTHPVISKIPTNGETSFSKNEYSDVDFNKWYTDITMNWDYENSDTGCDTDIDAWSPTETFSAKFWQNVQGEGQLMRLCVKGLDISAGDGLNVTIRTIGSFGNPTAAAACECLSCVSAGLSEYHLTIAQYGLSTEICGLDIFDVGENYPKEVAKSMGLSFTRRYDSLIYAALSGASPSVSEDMANVFSCSPSLVSTSCCIDQSLYDFYNAFNAAVAAHRAAEYDPQWLIVSPTVASVLKRMQEPSVQGWAERVIKIGDDGKLKSFNGLKVIEYFGATACSTVTDTVFAILVDPSRAVGCAFGKRPSLEKERNIDCNSWTYAMWTFVAIGVLDENAIAHIKSPDS